MTDIALSSEMKKSIINTTESALALKVTDIQTYTDAGEQLVLHKGLEKQIKAYFKPLKENAHKTWKSICTAENTEIDKLQPALKHLNGEMTTWNIKQEKLRKAEEDRLRREAEAKAEEEQLKAAEEAEASGNKEEAEEILNEPIYVAPPVVEKTVPKVAGQAMTTTWKWRLKNINKVPRKYLKIDESAINQVVKALKDKTEIDGIEVYDVSSMRGVRS